MNFIFVRNTQTFQFDVQDNIVGIRVTFKLITLIPTDKQANR